MAKHDEDHFDYNDDIKKIITHTTELVDENGEMKKIVSTDVLHIPREPEYVKFYVRDVSRLHGLTTKQCAILRELLKRMDYDGFVVIHSLTIEIIMEEADVKRQTIKNALGALCKSNVFKHIRNGVYQPNPHLFGRGKWKEIAKKRQAWISCQYEEDGSRTIKGSLGDNGDSGVFEDGSPKGSLGEDESLFNGDAHKQTDIDDDDRAA